MEKTRRQCLTGIGLLGIAGLSGCSGNSGPSDSDGDGMIDSEDYAPKDPNVQEKSDVSGGSGDQSSSGSSNEQSNPDSSETQSMETESSSSSVDPRISQIDVDVQSDIGTNNIGFDVETYFEDTARLTVQITDGERSDQRTFEGTSTSGTMQEFNDDINPPESFKDGEPFELRVILSVDGEEVDRKTVRNTYDE
ncbi:hypothetical protein M0R89_02355 [Halorussus limi]|uniref:Uncharacterized protein n=1 Tax=Halorussus limi TaxID=2938695 RepID=A0A8U0HVP2_9EURY|nr:hypothetical protein [Halorussus limi]UPV74919.1 hypothetical protein M0R89_02355 [Halorussus limi]